MSSKCVTLETAASDVWKRTAHASVTLWPGALNVINQQLWCCLTADSDDDVTGVVVLHLDDLTQVAMTSSGDMGAEQDVAQLSSGDVILATERGLYHTDVSGKTSLSDTLRS